ncbi:MAG TPA: hypothetical protein VMV68_00950, partial [Spirochaetia bacterium]|nr:hypothetical protein [Spirochaetia bacterium]
MYFHKIDHPANFSFVSTKKNPFPIGKRSFDFRVADLGDDVHRLEVRSRIWKGSGSLAGLDDTAFLDGGLKTAGDVAGNPSRAAAVAGGARRRSRIASARTTLTVGERAGIELSAGSRLALRSKEGRSFGVLGRKWIFCFELDPQMRFYGMGEKSGPFEKSGIKTLFWNTDAFS